VTVKWETNVSLDFLLRVEELCGSCVASVRFKAMFGECHPLTIDALVEGYVLVHCVM